MGGGTGRINSGAADLTILLASNDELSVSARFVPDHNKVYGWVGSRTTTPKSVSVGADGTRAP